MIQIILIGFLIVFIVAAKVRVKSVLIPRMFNASLVTTLGNKWNF